MTKIKISISEKRPDIAKLMVNYNEKYNIKTGNNPKEIGFGSTKIIHIRCDNGHDISDIANKISHLKLDKHHQFYCRECEQLGLIEVEKDFLQGVTVNELCKNNPEYGYLLNEWDFEINDKNGYTPDNITTGSERPLYWSCSNGHKFKMDIYNRLRRRRGCPYCNGGKLSKGFNDLASQNPEILKDWDYNKNDVLPDEIFQHAKRKVWWKCHKCGHEWEATVCRRTTNIQTGCPKCHTNATSIPEMSLYIVLNNHFKTVVHRKVINGFEYDIFIEDINLALEYDGLRFHGENGKSIDHKKTKNAKEKGFCFIRIKETDNENKHGMFENDILYISNKNRNKIKETCEILVRILNKKFKTNIRENVDKNIVSMARSEIKLKEQTNSVLSKSPKDAEEWCYELNKNVRPEYVSAGADNIKFWWKCKRCGNVYQKSAYAKINTFKNGGCIKCTPSYKTAIVCIETNTFYLSIAKASRDTGVHRSSIRDVCIGKQKTAGKLHWRYATEQEIKEQRVINT